MCISIRIQLYLPPPLSFSLSRSLSFVRTSPTGHEDEEPSHVPLPGSGLNQAECGAVVGARPAAKVPEVATRKSQTEFTRVKDALCAYVIRL